MAPILFPRDRCSTDFAPATMSNPNVTVLPVLKGRSASPVHDLIKMKTVHVGKNNHPVTIMDVVAVTSPVWLKKSCFNSLESNAGNLIESLHKLADVVNFLMEFWM